MSSGSDLQCRIYPFGSLSPIKYVVVCSFFEGKYLLSRHKERHTWETQGGHIESGETPIDAAKRELYEESGVKDATIYSICDYLGYDSNSSANGAVFLAEVHNLGVMPESEMREAVLFDVLPAELTYPEVTPMLLERARQVAWEKGIM